MTPRVSIVLLSYDRPQLLAASLRAIRAQTLTPREVIVVDNASPRAAEIAAVVAASPGVRLVAREENVGFASGMNLGLREAREELVLLTEDDIALAPDALEQLVQAHAAGPGDALYSTVMRDERSGEVWYAGGELTLGASFRMALPHRGAQRVEAPATYATGYLVGAVVFGAAATLRALGPYRDEYFMYFEDVELSIRCRTLGIPMGIVRDAEVTHFTPPKGTASSRVEFHKRKNMLATYLLHAPLAVLPAALARYGVIEVVRGTLERRDAVLLRSVGWVARRLPALLAERRRLARAARGRARAAPSPGRLA